MATLNAFLNERSMMPGHLRIKLHTKAKKAPPPSLILGGTVSVSTMEGPLSPPDPDPLEQDPAQIVTKYTEGVLSSPQNHPSFNPQNRSGRSSDLLSHNSDKQYSLPNGKLHC